MALGANAGDVYLTGHIRFPNARREITSQVQTPAMRAGEEASRHFGRKFAAGLAVSGAVIGAGLYKATRLATRGILATTDAASALNEQVNKSNAIFGSSSKEIQRWAAGARNNIGQSRTQALTAASAFGDMFLQLKVGQRPATDMSKKMVELASDLASFSDADITQVLEAQQAAFRGEYDSLQRFIPGINAARVQQVALNMTHKASAKDLTAAEKALATYRIMVEDTRRAQGDYANTLKTSVANQQRKAKAQWEDLKVTLGQGFLPAQLAVTRAFTEKLLPAGLIFVRELAPAISQTITAAATSFADAVPPASELAERARHLGERLSELGPGLGARVGQGLGKLFDLLQQLGPELRNANVQTSDLAPTLRLSGALFGFVADHADTLARHIPLLVAGFAAYKAAQAAANTAALLSLPIKAAEVAANIALARSNRALVASLGERTAATVTVTAAEGAATQATVAWGSASAASVGKLRLLTTALGAFAAALVVGDVVDRMTDRFGKWQKAVEVAIPVAGFFGVMVGGLKDAWAGMTGAQDKAAASTRVAMSAAERHTAALQGEKQAVDALKGALRGEETAELDVRQAKLNVSSAQRRLTDLTRSGRKGSLDYKQAQLDLRRAQLDLKGRTEEYKAAQLRSTAATRGAMQATQRAQGPYRKFGETAQTAGKRAYAMGLNAAAGLRLIKSKWISINTTFGFKTPPKTSLHQIVGATGGYVTPRAIVPRRLHRGGFLDGPGTETSDSIPARLSKGEYVVRAKAVRAVGRDTMDYINAQGFAAGGPVLDANFPSGSIMGRVARRFEGLIDRAMVHLAGKWDRYAKTHFELGGKAAVMRFIRSTDPLPYIWGGAGPRGYDCSGLVGAVHLAHLSRPYGRGQRLYTTSSIRAGMAGLKPGLGGVLQIGVTPGRGHMAGRYGGLGFEAESTRTGIKIGSAASRPESFARRYHLAAGGPVDIGGDPGRLRINGRTVNTRGGYLNPRAFSYAKHLLQRIRSGARVYEDFTWRGMPRSYGQWNDDIMRLVLPAIRGGYDFPRDLMKVSPILGSLIHRSAYYARGRGGHRLTARQLSALSDAQRWAYVDKHGRPPAPSGYVWAEDHTIVPRSFYNRTSYDRGGWLMPGTTIARNDTSKPERVLAPDERIPTADAIAKALARELRANPPVVAIRDIQAGMNHYAGRLGQARPYR